MFCWISRTLPMFLGPPISSCQYIETCTLPYIHIAKAEAGNECHPLLKPSLPRGTHKVSEQAAAHHHSHYTGKKTCWARGEFVALNNFLKCLVQTLHDSTPGMLVSTWYWNSKSIGNHGNICLHLGRERLVTYSPGHTYYMQLHRLSSESVYTELGVYGMDLGCSFYLYSPHIWSS